MADDAPALQLRREWKGFGAYGVPLLQRFPIGQNRNDFRLDWLAGHFDVFVGNVNVDLRSDAELSFLVNSGLDRKTNSGSDAPGIARLEIVDINAIAVSFFADGMAGAMGELFAESCARVITPRETSSTSAPRIVLPARMFLRMKSTAESRASLTSIENAGVFLRNGFAYVTSPSLVRRDCVRLVQFSGCIN